MLRFLRKTLLWILLLPVAFYAAGAASNSLVIYANGGKFPVQYTKTDIANWRASRELAIAKILDNTNPDDGAGVVASAQAKIYVIRTAEAEGMLDEVHCIMTSKTHLNLLADIFNLGGDGSVYSIGDGFMYAAEDSRDYLFLIYLVLVSSKLARKEN
jgi:hypothetical protein